MSLHGVVEVLRFGGEAADVGRRAWDLSDRDWNQIVAELRQRSTRARVAAVPGQGNGDELDRPIWVDFRRHGLFEQWARGSLVTKVGYGATDFRGCDVVGAHRHDRGYRPAGEDLLDLVVALDHAQVLRQRFHARRRCVQA